MRVVISCKDPLVEQHCINTFMTRFQAAVDRRQTVAGLEGLQRRFYYELRKEAARQEWFDYVEDPESPGGRRVIFEEVSNAFVAKLLVPDVRIEK